MMKWVGALSLLESARTDSKRRMPTMGCNLSKQRPVRPQRPTSDVSSSSKSHDGKKHSSKYKEVSEICVTYLLLAAERELNHFALLQQNKGFHTDYLPYLLFGKANKKLLKSKHYFGKKWSLPHYFLFGEPKLAWRHCSQCGIADSEWVPLAPLSW